MPAPIPTLRAARLAVLVTVASSLLGGCAGTPDRPERAALNDLLESRRAFVVPGPGGPSITGVVQRPFANAMQQKILLATDAATPGENMLRVRVYGAGDATLETPLPAPDRQQPAIRTEMAPLFPDSRMQISPYFARNAFGPFGYAVGRGAGQDLCLYAWQGLVAPRDRAGHIDLRLRLCRAGASEKALLEAMYGFTVPIVSAAQRRAAGGPASATGSAAPSAPSAPSAPVRPDATVLAGTPGPSPRHPRPVPTPPLPLSEAASPPGDRDPLARIPAPAASEPAAAAGSGPEIPFPGSLPPTLGSTAAPTPSSPSDAAPRIPSPAAADPAGDRPAG